MLSSIFEELANGGHPLSLTVNQHVGLSPVSCVLMASPDNNCVMVRSSGWSAGNLETPQESSCLETLAAVSQGRGVQNTVEA